MNKKFFTDLYVYTLIKNKINSIVRFEFKNKTILIRWDSFVYKYMFFTNKQLKLAIYYTAVVCRKI